MNVSEAMAASIGGAVSASILYPVDVITKKMQLSPPQPSNNSSDNDTTTNNDTTPTTLSRRYSFYNNDNKTSLFRGIEIAAIQSAIEKYCYVISYNLLKRIHTTWLSSNTKSINNFYINVLYGYISQWVHLPITIPLDVWKTHIQLVSMNNDINPSTNHINQWKILYNMIKDPNVQIYKGLSTYIIICWKPAIQYTIYEYLKRKIIVYNKLKTSNNNIKNTAINLPIATTSKQNYSISWKESILLALISRTIATILIYPHIRAKLQLQQASSSLSTKNTVTNVKHEQEIEQTQFEEEQQLQDDNTDQTTPTNSIQDVSMTSSYNGSKTSLSVTASTNTKGVITHLLQILNIPHYLDFINTKNNDNTMRILRQYFDIISYYYKGIGPELIRGGISAIISYLIQEYIRIKTK